MKSLNLIKTLIFCFFVVIYPQIGKSASDNSFIKCRVETDKGILPTGRPQRTIIKVSLDAPPPSYIKERLPVNLSIVLDRSGSMSGQKIEKAKDAAVEALRRLGQKDIFSLVVYDHNVDTIVPAQNARNTEWIESRIRSIYPGGNTALFGGVSQGASEIRKNAYSGYINRIILLSDGIANVGPSSPDDLGRLGNALIKEGISVTTIGVGTDYNEDLMTRLSQNSDGNSYFVESSIDLPRIFAGELGDVLSVAAKQVTIVIECREGVRPINIIGREGRIRGNTVELYLNQLYANQEKYVLMEVEVPPGKEGQTINMVDVKINYHNPITKKNEASYGSVSAKFSSNERAVEKSVNVGVQREYHLNVNALVQDKAISLSDKGKKDEAVKELKQSSSVLREAGRKYEDTKLIKKAEEMEEQAKRIEKEGMTSRNRKALRTESYQLKNQQSKE
ncbi:MAG: VWA domain-containing protein [Desulfobacterales bacterium]|nr:VWA domain-containing protein [Desulfobacterales bacterium]